MTQELVTDGRTDNAKDFARILYIAHALVIVFTAGTLSIILLILNYIKRPDTVGTFVYSHHSWMIRTFWIYVIGMAIAWLLVVTVVGMVVGFPLMFILWVWYCYRVIRGFVDLNNNQAME